MLYMAEPQDKNFSSIDHLCSHHPNKTKHFAVACFHYLSKSQSQTQLRTCPIRYPAVHEYRLVRRGFEMIREGGGILFIDLGVFNTISALCSDGVFHFTMGEA